MVSAVSNGVKEGDPGIQNEEPNYGGGSSNRKEDVNMSNMKEIHSIHITSCLNSKKRRPRWVDCCINTIQWLQEEEVGERKGNYWYQAC